MNDLTTTVSTLDFGAPAAPPTKLDYDATDDRGRRRAPPRITKSEDRHADETKRRILSASSRDLGRNFAIAAWAIRKHLDYVSTFSLQFKTPDKGFNDYAEDLMKTKMTRQSFDISRRHSFRRFVRITEASRVRDGDLLWLKVAGGANRGRVQAIEGDRVRLAKSGNLPRDLNREDWTNGVRLDGNNRAVAFAICDRAKRGNSLVHKRLVSARNTIQHGFFDRFDQVRGVSPIAAGLNWFRDTYEGFEYALAKVKVDQLFGLVFMRDGEAPAFAGDTSATVDSDGDGVDDAGYEVDLGRSGPFTLDLDAGDKAEVLSSKTPSSETTNFLKLMIHIALKSIDIPFSFFDESFTNFYGSRGGLIQYLKSCEEKIADLVEVLDEWIRWRLALLILDGELQLPSGRDYDWLSWQFVPKGVPWWDPVKEARGAAMSIAMGASNPYRECHAIGTDFEDNVDKIAQAQEYAREKGVSLVFADSTAFRPEITTDGEGDNT